MLIKGMWQLEGVYIPLPSPDSTKKHEYKITVVAKKDNVRCGAKFNLNRYIETDTLDVLNVSFANQVADGLYKTLEIAKDKNEGI